MIEDLTAGFAFAVVVVNWVILLGGYMHWTASPFGGWLAAVTEPLPESCNVRTRDSFLSIPATTRGTSPLPETERWKPRPRLLSAIHDSEQRKHPAACRSLSIVSSRVEFAAVDAAREALAARPRD